jgi:hypothetical protein
MHLFLSNPSKRGLAYGDIDAVNISNSYSEDYYNKNLTT